ncbi:MAG: hydroxymethylpyrimidine/phosphomethylpyrimidine kinase [Bacteroidales bacterium]|nr:hydroxymethylpyrimidine/phosphomethylpyrimidine kinase [Bacteroidales bacterium]
MLLRRNFLFMKTIVSIGAFDPTGGAGVLADIRVAGRFGVYGMSVLTAATSQNPKSFNGVEAVSDDMFRKQISDVFGHYRVDAMKCGMIATKSQLKILIDFFSANKPQNLVVDPIISATLGNRVFDKETIDLYRELCGYALLVTPNEKETEILKSIASHAILNKGGDANSNICVDILKIGDEEIKFTSEKIKTTNTHGTGCTMSSAIASCLAIGYNLKTSVKIAHDYVNRAIAGAVDLDITEGYGPLNHFVETE